MESDVTDAPLTPEAQTRLMIAVASDHDRQAFARLFEHFAPRVKAFLMRPGLAAGVAEELTQETMLTVWRKAHYFDPLRAGVSTWIFTIARNLRIDHLRRGQLPADYLGDASEEPDHPPGTDEILVANERDERVREAMKTLSDEQATVVRLSFFSEKPHVEIARELGIPLGTVKSRVRLAMQRLRTLLDDVL